MNYSHNTPVAHLSRFNILHSSPDMNFDRIAYLTKLVFSMKIVVVSLVDENEE